MSDGKTPSSSPATPPAPAQAAPITAAPLPPTGGSPAWQWGLSVPPATLPSVAEGLSSASRNTVPPPSAHVPVEAASNLQTVWNPLDGDPLRMAALGASSAVQSGLTPLQTPAPPSSNGKDAATARPVSDDARPETTPTGARLRPVTGRRQREPLPVTVNITAGSYRSNLAPPPAALATPASAMTGESIPYPASSPRRLHRWRALFVAIILSIIAAAAIWFLVPPRFVLQASLAFERSATAPGATRIDNDVLRDFHQSQEALLWSDEVRDAAIGTLQKEGDLEPGFLRGARQIAKAVRAVWNQNSDATREELAMEITTTHRDADAARLTALVHALHAAASATTSRGKSQELKLQLLQTEVTDYVRELDYLKRRVQSLEEELRLVKLGAPREGEIDALKNDVAHLAAAYQNALAARIRAEVEAGVAPTPVPPTTIPATVADAPVPQPVPSDLDQSRKLERETLVELRTRERHLAEAIAQQESIDQKQRELDAVGDTIKSLARSLEEKQKELAVASDQRQPVFKPLPSSPVRVIEEDDGRPLWIGVAVAVIAFACAAYVTFASRSH